MIHKLQPILKTRFLLEKRFFLNWYIIINYKKVKSLYLKSGCPSSQLAAENGLYNIKWIWQHINLSTSLFIFFFFFFQKLICGLWCMEANVKHTTVHDLSLLSLKTYFHLVVKVKLKTDLVQVSKENMKNLTWWWEVTEEKQQ